MRGRGLPARVSAIDHCSETPYQLKRNQRQTLSAPKSGTIARARAPPPPPPPPRRCTHAPLKTNLAPLPYTFQISLYSARPHAKSPTRSCPIPDPADEPTSVLAHIIVVDVVDLLAIKSSRSSTYPRAATSSPQRAPPRPP
eukprot:scaffold21478_cov67-Phaeocystis_antarctica.AAC.1